MLGFKLEENWVLSTLWVWVSAKIPAQAAHWEVLEVWPGPAELGVGTAAELRPCCASLCFTLALPLLGEEVLSGGQSRGTQPLGSACGSAEEVEPPKEQSRALPAQEPKTPRPWGSISPRGHSQHPPGTSRWPR